MILEPEREEVKGKGRENKECPLCKLCPTRDCVVCRVDHKKGHLLPSEEEKRLDFLKERAQYMEGIKEDLKG